VGITAGSREVPGRKPVTIHNNDDDDNNNNNNNNNRSLQRDNFFFCETMWQDIKHQTSDIN
jgi:hypothetical protein